MLCTLIKFKDDAEQVVVAPAVACGGFGEYC